MNTRTRRALLAAAALAVAAPVAAFGLSHAPTGDEAAPVEIVPVSAPAEPYMGKTVARSDVFDLTSEKPCASRGDGLGSTHFLALTGNDSSSAARFYTIDVLASTAPNDAGARIDRPMPNSPGFRGRQSDNGFDLHLGARREAYTATFTYRLREVEEDGSPKQWRWAESAPAKVTIRVPAVPLCDITKENR